MLLAGRAQALQTYRFRRRRVMPIRVTWLGQVALVLLLAHLAAFRAFAPGAGMGARVLAFILGVALPVVAVTLWRAGLLPPERVAVPGPEEARGTMTSVPSDDERSAP